jgi:hypothetical protein
VSGSLLSAGNNSAQVADLIQAAASPQAVGFRSSAPNSSMMRLFTCSFVSLLKMFLVASSSYVLIAAFTLPSAAFIVPAIVFSPQRICSAVEILEGWFDRWRRHRELGCTHSHAFLRGAGIRSCRPF